jgi:gliding motility-associated-like protein
MYLLPTITAFISGNDTICSNTENISNIQVDLGGIPPFTFEYSLNGVVQNPITTNYTPYYISTNIAGTYDLVSFSDAVEVGNLSGQAFITVVEAPNAEFIPEPDTMTILYTSTKMIDMSTGNINSWLWNFGDNSSVSNASSPFHTYSDSIASYQINLLVRDVFGCSDSTYKIVTVRDDFWFYIPNSFTPDSDDTNDKFQIRYHGIREETFIINIYNRYNEVVFSSENINELSTDNGWDGRHHVKDFALPGGTYVYELYFQDFDGWKHHENGFINLIR